MAIPAVAVDETLAVLEFFSAEQIEATDRLLRALNGIGHEIGYFWPDGAASWSRPSSRRARCRSSNSPLAP